MSSDLTDSSITEYECLDEDASRQNPIDIEEKVNSLSKSFTAALKSQDLWTAADIASKIRRIISDESTCCTLHSDIVKDIIKLLGPRFYQRERLLIECSWILVNIACGDEEEVEYLVKLGITKKGLALLKHPNLEVKKNAIWLLANLAATNKYRDQLIEEGIVKQIEWVLQSAAPRPSLLSKVTLLISNLIRGKPYPNFQKTKPFVKYIKLFMKNFHNREIRANTLWILSYFTDGDSDQIQAILDLDPCQKLFESLKFQEKDIRAAALRTVGNFLTGEDYQTEELIRKGVIDHLAPFLNDTAKTLRKEACWALSNIMAGDETQVEKVFRHKKGAIVKKLFQMISSDEPDVAKECVLCLTNACYTATIEQIQELLNMRIIKLLMDTLRRSSEKYLIVACLEALECILQKCHDQEDFEESDCEDLEKQLIQCGGIVIIRNLQHHDDLEVQKIILRLMLDFCYFGHCCK